MLENMDGELTLLALLVALSAYLSGVRVFLLARMTGLRGSWEAPKREQIKKTLWRLVWADAPLVVSATLLSYKMFWPILCKAAFDLDWFIVFAFSSAILVVISYHAVFWFTSFDERYELGLAERIRRWHRLHAGEL